MGTEAGRDGAGAGAEPEPLAYPWYTLPARFAKSAETLACSAKRGPTGEADHYINKRILVVGGGDSAVEAAMGLANQPGNQVTLSYRKEAFSRIKERNAQRIEQCMRSGKVKVLFDSMPTEFKEGSVILEVSGVRQELANDFVWVFAGGTPPSGFLKKIGVGFGMHDMTAEAGAESRATGLLTPVAAPAS